MEIKGVSMIADVADANGNVVTKEALKGMIENFKSCQVTYNFNPHIPPLGIANKAEVEGNRLIITADIKDVKPFNEKLALAPSFEVKQSHKDGDIFVIDSAYINEVALTHCHSDDGVTYFDL